MKTISKAKASKFQAKPVPKKEEPKLLAKPAGRDPAVIKAEAVAKVAYDRADVALKATEGFNGILEGLKQAVQEMGPPKKGYRMKLNRNKDGFIASIDVELK